VTELGREVDPIYVATQGQGIQMGGSSISAAGNYERAIPPGLVPSHALRPDEHSGAAGGTKSGDERANLRDVRHGERAHVSHD
jgi:hypothetical protein